MTDIELRNEGGVIKGYDRDTGEQVPVSFEDAKFNSVQANELNNVDYITHEHDLHDVLSALEDGDHIHLLDGVYEGENFTIDDVKNVTITGDPQATIKHPGGDSYGMLLVVESNVDSLKIEGLTLDGNRHELDDDYAPVSSDEVIELDGSNCLIRECRILRAPYEGIDIDIGSNNKIRDNYVEDCGGWGIHTSENSSGTTVSGNTVVNCGYEEGRGGIDIWDTADTASVVNNTIVDCRRGLELAGDAGTFSANTVKGGTDGVRLRDGTNGLLSNNTIKNTSNRGVIVDSANARVIDNTISETGGDGISVTTGDNWEIVGNRIEDVDGDAIDLSNTTGFGKIDDNVIDSPSGFGLRVWDPSKGNGSVSNNKFIADENSSAAAILFQNTDYISIVGNTSEGFDWLFEESGTYPGDNHSIVANVSDDGEISYEGENTELSANNVVSVNGPA